jgi:hypothetical protein
MKKDQIALGISIIFSVLMLCAIAYFGSKYVHPAFLPDQGASWYYWKLPTVEFWPRFTGWLFFILHLSSTLFIAYKAKNDKEVIDNNLSKYNYLMLGTNAFFVILHLIQTSIWYDSLAQDTPVWLSQFSVIGMLVLILIMLNGRRGLFFGKKIPISTKVTTFVTKWHSFYILVSLIFTFWYHPMEASVGHFAGFFYMFLLFTQSSLMFTKMHFNKYWIFTLEFAVLIHGTLVAIMQGNGMWPMFAFGFGFIAVATHIYLLNLNKWINLILQFIYVAAVIAVYSSAFGFFRPISKVYEISFIPVTEYLLVFILVGAIALGFWIQEKLSKR